MSVRSIVSIDRHDPQRGARPVSDAPPPSLEEIVRELGSSAASWIDRVRLTTDRRWYERLCSGPDYDVWVISWMPGQSTGFHDHGGSSGAFQVVSGLLEEHSPGQRPRTLTAGDIRRFGPRYVHDVRNVSSAPAISVHAYSPALTEMAHYGFDGNDLRPIGSGGAEMNQDNQAVARLQSQDEARVCRIDSVVASARQRLRRVTPREAHEALEAGAILVDIRPDRQRAHEGIIREALIIERNVLEWRLDPTSPDRLLHDAGRDLQPIVICSEGYASSLAADSLQALGLWRATDVIGGFQAWRAEGLPWCHL